MSIRKMVQFVVDKGLIKEGSSSIIGPRLGHLTLTTPSKNNEFSYPTPAFFVHTLVTWVLVFSNSKNSKEY
jgi:hypothetical protein